MTSPTELAGLHAPPIQVPVYAPDGRRVHRFRQSSMKELDICTERARLTMTGQMPKDDSDAASAGTAVHHGIDVFLGVLLDDGEVMPLDLVSELAQDFFGELMSGPDFRWVKFKEGGARAFIDKALAAWYDDVRPTLTPRASEVNFGPLILHEDDERIIEVTGSIDYLDALGLKDWKTSGRAWEAWEHERWDVQPSVYTWAAHTLGLIEPDADGRFPFEFVVFVNGQRVHVQRVTVYRHSGDWAWLIERCLGIATLIEANVPEWPKNDNHALCSPKWCPAWSMCKGKHYGPSWPKPSLPALSSRDPAAH